ncbi:hypothetical protein MIMGU_mgv1a016339mg [Erythranthe guttata]|uniref:Uncharacterized protein n=1 Tax=Erythranthe guttata TaxID=4155 RepID=A0A022PXJ1_ERYGU|nr:hypothetical protein MIMGU_mgv1a016339mg [Erythranthe guttata]
MFKLMPSTLALIAVQRQAATSKSASPSSTAQHFSPEGGAPITTFTSPNRSAHTPSFSVSLGQKGFTGATFGGGFGFGSGAGSSGSQVPHAVVKAAERKKDRIKTAAESLVAAMASYEESLLSLAS